MSAKSKLDQPLKGRPRVERAAPRRHYGVAISGSMLGLAILSASVWAGLDTWGRFSTPEPIIAASDQAAAPATDPTATGTVAATPETAALDPARPNELSRTVTEGGSAIITVKPPEVTDGQGSVIVRDPSQLTQTAMLAHLPLPELIEREGERRLPRRGEDGTRPFDAYARAWSGSAGPRIAIVIGGLGLSQTGTQEAVRRLPEDVTLAFASEGNSLDRWMQAARRDGHEILLQVPMEPFGYPEVKPGRFTLEADAAPEAIVESLHRALARTTNYAGITNHMGARFLGEPKAAETLFAELGRRGLGFLDDGAAARSLSKEAAAAGGVPFARADLLIDADREPGAILAKLNELEQTARSQGTATGIGSAFDETVDVVARWMVEARKRGIEFVPVSAVSADPERR
jgi:uncharacterized protein